MCFCQRCMRFWILSIEVLVIDKSIHSYAVVVVFTDAVPKDQKRLRKLPSLHCTFLIFSEQHIRPFKVVIQKAIEL